MIKNIAVLGSTGSIGTQTLDIIRSNPDKLSAHLLTANNNYTLLIEQACEFMPDTVVIANPQYYPIVKEALCDLPIKVWSGSEAISEAVQAEPIHIVIAAMVGYSGLLPTLSAIKARKTIGLANKETLVVAGELVMHEAEKHRVNIIPVDSEHSAIFQCLVGEHCKPEKLILTASGGPFLNHTPKEMEKVTIDSALKHPNWSMGAKVTIDSASMMNKGFEVIEAHWLFDMSPNQIEVLVHPQSIVHSMVQYSDGAVKAQLGIPDMRLPIGYALGLTHRIPNDYPRIDLTAQPLTFQKPDTVKFPNLAMAYEALRKGGNATCALNAANEVAVSAFLAEQISFVSMSKLLERCMSKYSHIEKANLNELIQTDTEVRALAREIIHTL